MAKRTERSIKKVEGVDASFLVPHVEEDNSLDLMTEHVVLPRVKIIQGMTDQTLKEQFGEGSIILRPGDALVAGKGETFDFVPLFFYAEYCKWSDRRDDENPTIMERSFDKTSDIAKRALDPSRRMEVYEEDKSKPADKQKRFRWVEHYNFPGVIYGDHPLAGTQVTLSFSKGEHSVGSNLIQAIRMRREEIDGERRKVPLWAQVWNFRPSFRDRGDNKWWGLDYQPGEVPLIQPEEAEDMRKAYEDFSQLHEAKKLAVDYDDENKDDPAETAGSGEF